MMETNRNKLFQFISFARRAYLYVFLIIFLFFVLFTPTASVMLNCETCTFVGGTCIDKQCPSGQAMVDSIKGGSQVCCAKAGLEGASSFFREAGGKAGFRVTAQQLEPEVVIGRIIEGALVIIGTIFGILMVYAGYLWMQARGNEEYVKKAKGILEAAIIGIILVMAAYAITAFIVSRVIGAAQFGG